MRRSFHLRVTIDIGPVNFEDDRHWTELVDDLVTALDSHQNSYMDALSEMGPTKLGMSDQNEDDLIGQWHVESIEFDRKRVGDPHRVKK